MLVGKLLQLVNRLGLQNGTAKLHVLPGVFVARLDIKNIPIRNIL